jgi:hypothetical protein
MHRHIYSLLSELYRSFDDTNSTAVLADIHKLFVKIGIPQPYQDFRNTLVALVEDGSFLQPIQRQK